MTAQMKVLLEKALQLSPEERALLVDSLSASLHGPQDPDVAEAVTREIEDRLDAYDRGEMTGHPARDVLAKYLK